MADDFTAKNATGATVTFDSEDVGGGKQRPRRHIAAIASGASVDIGAVANAAVDTDTTGSLIGHLRGLKKLFLARTAALGLTTASASMPVIPASDWAGAPILAGTASIGGVKYNGVQWTAVRAIKDSADLSTIADLTAAPSAGEKIVIDELFVSSLTAMTLTISEETTTTVMLKVLLAANAAPVSIQFPSGRKLDTADKKARIQASAAGAIFVYCTYHSEA